MNRWNERDGFALPMVLLLLLVTTGAVMSSLNMGAVERKVLDGETAALDALVLAEAGLERFATRHKDADFFAGAFPDVEYDSVRVDLAAMGGYADVVVQRLRPELGDDPALYLIRSRGVRTRGGWSGAPQSVRMVTRLGEWLSGRLDVHSAWTGITGLRKNGASGSVSGYDECGEEAAVAGVAVPQDPGYTGHTTPVSGSPPIKYLGSTPQEAADSVAIDWPAIMDGSALQPDYTIPGDNWYDIDFTDWPVILIDNPGAAFSLPEAAGQRGTLIVRGDMEIDGSNLWDGVILIGGVLTSNGNNAVFGATVSGLNTKLGHTVGQSDIGNGTKEFVFHSCNVRQAMKAQSRMRVLENTWLDSWALY